MVIDKSLIKDILDPDSSNNPRRSKMDADTGKKSPNFIGGNEAPIVPEIEEVVLDAELKEKDRMEELKKSKSSFIKELAKKESTDKKRIDRE